jgi:hypothetical protein
MRWMKHVARIGSIRNAYQILVENLEHKRLPERLAIERSLNK